MSSAEATTALVAARDAALLVSVHDVSPLTLAMAQAAVELVTSAGVPTSCLTLLVIPFHERQVRITADDPTVRWLKALRDDGAELVMHGLTHRMGPAAGRVRWRGPLGWYVTRGFARGQGEFANLDAAETRDRLDQGREILEGAGLADATCGFGPPAWLLSNAARQTVRDAGFAYYELLSGLRIPGDRCLAPRCIGWGSLTGVEAVATNAWAALQARRTPVDTRIAVHPHDMRRARSRRSIERTLRRLVERCTLRRYRDHVAACA